MNKPYHFEFPIPADDIECISEPYATIEECVEACKVMCKELGVNYDDREVKLFMTNRDGVWEVTEEGEFAD